MFKSQWPSTRAPPSSAPEAGQLLFRARAAPRLSALRAALCGPRRRRSDRCVVQRVGIDLAVRRRTQLAVIDAAPATGRASPRAPAWALLQWARGGGLSCVRRAPRPLDAFNQRLVAALPRRQHRRDFCRCRSLGPGGSCRGSGPLRHNDDVGRRRGRACACRRLGRGTGLGLGGAGCCRRRRRSRSCGSGRGRGRSCAAARRSLGLSLDLGRSGCCRLCRCWWWWWCWWWWCRRRSSSSSCALGRPHWHWHDTRGRPPRRRRFGSVQQLPKVVD